MDNSECKHSYNAAEHPAELEHAESIDSNEVSEIVSLGWEVDSQTSFSKRYDFFTDAVEVFSYAASRPVDGKPMKPRPSHLRNRTGIGSKLQQVKEYTSAVERLSLWWERDESSRKSRLAANRILFRTTYLGACVQCYRKSIKKMFIAHWKLATENSRIALDTIFTTPGAEGTLREGRDYGLYDHI